MNTNKTVSIKFCLLILINMIFIGCQNESSNKINTNQAKLIFNTKESEKKIQDLNDIEQWEFLAETINQPFQNKLDVKNWIDLKIKQKIKNPNGLTCDLLESFSFDLFSKHFDKQAIDLANFSLHSSWGKKNCYKQSIPALILSNHYSFKQEIDSLIKYNLILKQYIDEKSLNVISITYYKNQAEIEEKRGDFFQAVVNYYKAIELTPKEDKENLSTLYHDLAVTYINLEYVEKAIEFMELSLNNQEIESIPLDRLNMIGIIYSKSNNFTKADFVFKKAIEKSTKEKNKIILAQTYANYGNLHRKMKKFNLALKYINQSDEICNEIEMFYGLLINTINRAEIYHDQGSYYNAKEELEKCRQNLEKIDDIKLNKEFYNLFYRIQDELGNTNEANKYYRKYYEYKNQYFGDLSKTIIAEWQLQNEKNASLKQQTDFELSIQKKNRKILLISLLSSLLMLVFILIYIVLFKRNVKEKEKLQLEKQKIAYELELKSKELLADTLKNISISSVKENIFHEIQDILSELPKTHQGKLLTLALRLKQSVEPGILEEFNTRFTGVYESFYTNLALIAPELTPTEMNVCALIRLNLTSKEIAVLTNRTVGTVENIRTGIRKKLKLGPDSNLQKELWNIQ